jgi:glycosyltransferase involved in cell wall biosynthesis
MTRYTLVTGDLAQTGGMDYANWALASYLARTGRQVHVVAYRASADLLANRNVTFHRIRKPLNAYMLGAPLLGASGVLDGLAALRSRGRVVVNGGNCPFPGINWVHYVHAAFAPALGDHAFRFAKGVLAHRLSVFTEFSALRMAARVVTNSSRTRQEVIERVGVAADRVHTVYLGVDAERFQPPTAQARAEARRALGWTDARQRVLFIGALGDRRKGFDILYGAWRKLARSASWDALLAVVGAGADLPVWRERAARDGLAAQVAFLGFREDIPRVLAASDVLVSPARYEPYGLAVQEALCCGLPALVSARAGIAERYPPALSRLLLDDPESSDALAGALARWRAEGGSLQNELLAFSRALRLRNWDVMAREFVDLCEQDR